MPEDKPKSAAGNSGTPQAAGGSNPGGNRTARISNKMQEGDYQFLPLQCPNCGLEGKVKISRLDRTFTCKQCDKEFHVTLDGTVSGERPPDATDVDPANMVAEETQTQFEKWLARLPRTWQMALGGVCLLILGVGIKVLTEPEEPLPGELEARAKFAAQALARDEWKKVKRLALPGTAKDLGRWYDRARPESWSGANSESQVKVQLGTVVKNLRGYEKNEPLIDSIVPVTIGIPGKGKPQDVKLIFSKGEELEWWLNGEQMAKQAPAPE